MNYTYTLFRHDFFPKYYILLEVPLKYSDEYFYPYIGVLDNSNTYIGYVTMEDLKYQNFKENADYLKRYVHFQGGKKSLDKTFQFLIEQWNKNERHLKRKVWYKLKNGEISV